MVHNLYSEESERKSLLPHVVEFPVALFANSRIEIIPVCNKPWLLPGPRNGYLAAVNTVVTSATKAYSHY